MDDSQEISAQPNYGAADLSGGKREADVSGVFVSYATADLRIATQICRALERNGIPCWIATKAIRASEDFGAEIIKGIRRSRAVVLIQSRNANASPYVPLEVAQAFQQKIPIIVFRVDSAEIEDSLALRLTLSHRIEAGPNWKGKLQQLIRDTATAVRNPLPEGPVIQSSFVPAATGAGVILLAVLLAASLGRVDWWRPFTLGLTILAPLAVAAAACRGDVRSRLRKESLNPRLQTKLTLLAIDGALAALLILVSIVLAPDVIFVAAGPSQLPQGYRLSVFLKPGNRDKPDWTGLFRSPMAIGCRGNKRIPGSTRDTLKNAGYLEMAAVAECIALVLPKDPSQVSAYLSMGRTVTKTLNPLGDVPLIEFDNR